MVVSSACRPVVAGNPRVRSIVSALIGASLLSVSYVTVAAESDTGPLEEVVVGLEHARAVTADLSSEGAQRYAQVVVGNNAVRR